MINQIETQIVSLVDTIAKQGVTIATVESCTGGMLSQYLTAKAGSSLWFLGALVTYSNQSKIKLASVSEVSLSKYGPISQCVAEEMSSGGAKIFNSDICVSITGLAGPSGDGINPIGTVWISWSTNKSTHSKVFYLDGNRLEIRLRAVLEACNGINKMIKDLKLK